MDALERLSGVRPGASVLDLCCGPGRHALELAARGYAVTGVDISEQYLAAARESAEAQGLAAEFLHGDARAWSRAGAFDLAINLFTSFGYFDTREEDERLLARAFESLKAGGTLVMEFIGKENAARDFIEGEWFERDGRLVLTEFEIVGDWEYKRNRWIVIDGARRVDRSWLQRLYAGTEIKDSLRRAGFRSVELFGAWEGTPYDATAHRLVAVARK